jgi:2,5-diamino-6-(ribosylamino)-4(3H)-pyrimidinone 5'-phosphate reductase
MKPYVICHMLMSLDGRIVTLGWPLSSEGRGEYEVTGSSFDANAWMCGRVTMAAFARGEAPAKTPERAEIQKSDYIASGKHSSYAIAIDASGKLNWETNEIGGDHIVTVLTERVATSYLAALQSHEVSYLFGGCETIDLALVLDKLAREFGIDKLLVEGGGKINGAMLEAGLIDELSILVAPIADGSVGTPSLFDLPRPVAPNHAAVRWRLRSLDRRSDDIIWLRYVR